MLRVYLSTRIHSYMSALTVTPLARMDTEETKEDTPSLTCSSESQEDQDATVLLGWLSQAPCLSRSQPGPRLGSGCLVQSTLGCTPEPQTALLDTLRGHTQHSWSPPSAKAQGPSLLAHPGSSAPTAPSSDLRAHPAKVTHLAANSTRTCGGSSAIRLFHQH